MHNTQLPLRIIYVPGFGDHFDWLRQLALRRWRSRTVTVSLVPMDWNDRQETYEQKYQRIAQEIDKYPDETIMLVGESAGGAMALYAYDQLKPRVHQVVTLCGYNHGASGVHPFHKTEHPAFYRLMPVVDEVVENLSESDLACVKTFYSTRDSIVYEEHSVIDGTPSVILNTRGHFSSIARLLVSKLPLRSLDASA